MIMNLSRIKDLISEKISGEWGIEPASDKCVKIIRTTNFTNTGKINFSNIVEREISDSKIDQKKLRNGDIIIEKSGGSPTQPVGRVVFFDSDKHIYLCNNFTSILRPSEKTFPKYLFFSLFYLYQKNKTLNYQNKTTGIINLQLDRYIQTEKIPLPTLQHQERIVKILDKADSLLQKRKQAISLLDEYLKSVFLEMFGDPIINSKGWESYSVGSVLENIIAGWSAKGEDKI
jgi:type I restriction enzyme, S subunit